MARPPWVRCAALLCAGACSAACTLGALNGLSGGDIATTTEGGTTAAGADGEDASAPDATNRAEASDGDTSPSTSVAWRSTATAIFGSVGYTSFTIMTPPSATEADVLIAVLALGNSDNTAPPMITPPSDWSLVRRIDHMVATALLVYTHIATADEPASYTWTSSSVIEGVAWISAYSGVDTTHPIDVENGTDISSASASYAAPALSPGVSRGLVVEAFATHGTASAFTAPADTRTRANIENGDTRSGLGMDFDLTGAAVAATSVTLQTAHDYCLADALVLRAK